MILAGVAIRLLLLLQWPARVNADEATVGLMGLQILRGEFPIFFSGQGYKGGAGGVPHRRRLRPGRGLPR